LPDDQGGPALPAGYRLISYDSIGSTNDEAKRLARAGADERTVIWALQQTAGRGRRGRAWVSPRGNFYASLIMRPDCPADHAPQLGFVAALAIGGALAELAACLCGLSYKWPNDVLVNGCKIAGILLESEMSAVGKLSFLVVGVGVNLAVAPRDTEFPATSAAAERLGPIQPATMLEAFLRHFGFWQERWGNEGFSPVRAAWRAAAGSRGEQIRVRLEGATLFGRFVDIDEQGILLLDCAGECRRISAGEVFPAGR
jgi:BirA family transcriptional regulator, biotin operon repressor / biotin---[acetyl-CoA-carboxylase] ligase